MNTNYSASISDNNYSTTYILDPSLGVSGDPAIEESPEYIDDRINWDDYFLGIAEAVSRRGDCRRSQVGAVIVLCDNRTIFIGYNGTLPKQPGCLLGACPRGRLSYRQLPSYSNYGNCIGIHAEKNALDSLLFCGADPRGAKVYITRAPCIDCQDLLFDHGLERAVWPQGHRTFIPRL